MPQLNPEFFVSQLFWLFITFSFLLVFLWRISLPRISSVLEKRKRKINDDIESAKKLQTEAEGIQLKIDQQLSDAKKNVNDLIKKTNNNLENNISIQLKKIDTDLLNKINQSESIIEKNKSDSIKNIFAQIQEITILTVSKLANISITDKEIQDSIKSIQYKQLN